MKRRSPVFHDLFSRYADALLAQMMQSVACNALHSIEARCSRWLLSTHDRVGQTAIPLTQEALAEMLGVQRTTVTAVARALQARGLIRYTRGRLEIVNRVRLDGKKSVAPYFSNYATRPHWQFIPGFVDDRPAILVYDADDPDQRLKYFVLLDWADEQVVGIRDFVFARYAMEGAKLAVLD